MFNNIESKVVTGITTGALLVSGCTNYEKVKIQPEISPTTAPITQLIQSDTVNHYYKQEEMNSDNPNFLENTDEIYYPLVKGYYGITERIKDPNIIKNMHTAMDYINDYTNNHPIQSFYIEYDSLKDFLKQVKTNKDLLEKGLRYNTAMNYYKDTEKWLSPSTGGTIGIGACDIATTIKRAIVKNYKQEGSTEWQMGHKIEKWGPFIIISTDHPPYEGMPNDEIAVDIYNGREAFLEMSENSEFVIFFLKKDFKEPTKEIKIFLEEQDNIYTSNLLIRYLDKNLFSN